MAPKDGPRSSARIELASRGPNSSSKDISRIIAGGECEVCAFSKSKKSVHSPSGRPFSKTWLALVHVDLREKHPVESYRGCQSLVMVMNDMSRKRREVLSKTKPEAAGALK